MLLIFATPEEARELLELSTRQPEIVRPQTSGPCVHYDERSEHAADTDPCTYPYGDERSDGVCPHLDNPDVLCPVKDACYAMSEVARMRGECEQEQREQDADMAAVAPSQTYETAAPEWVEPEPDERSSYAIHLPLPAKRKDAWTEEENWTVARADTRAEAIEIYRAAYPDSTRTDKAIRSRWEKLHRDCKEPIAPDFVGDAVPVTQCDEEAFAVPRPTFRPGDRVRIKHALHRGQTGEIQRYFPATENYLVAIDGLPDRIILRDKDLEVEA